MTPSNARTDDPSGNRRRIRRPLDPLPTDIASGLPQQLQFALGHRLRRRFLRELNANPEASRPPMHLQGVAASASFYHARLLVEHGCIAIDRQRPSKDRRSFTTFFYSTCWDDPAVAGALAATEVTDHRLA
jgi:hypothetical protein